MKIRQLFAIGAAIILSASCSNELPAGQEESLFGNIPEGMTEYRFTLKGITPTRLTYAGDVAMEQKEMEIHSAKILVFGQKSAGTLTDTDKLVHVRNATIQGNEVRYLIPSDTDFSNAVKVGVIMIVNEANSNYSDLNLIMGQSTYADLKVLLNSADAGAEVATKGLLQIGKVLDLEVPSAGGNLTANNMELVRPFARFDIKNEGMKALTITSMKIGGITDKYQVLTGTFPAGVSHTYQKEVQVPADLNRPEGVLTPIPALVPAVFYSFPGSVAGNDSPKLLITGFLSTQTEGVKELTDYPVPFTKDGVPLRILENKRYRLTLNVDVDDIIVDITESIADWGSDADSNYDMDLNKETTVVRVGDGLTLQSIASGRFSYNGTPDQKMYNFSIANEPADKYTVTATADMGLQTIKKIESYGGITHYELALSNEIAYTKDLKKILIEGKKDGESTALFTLEILQSGGSGNVPVAEQYPLDEHTNIAALKAGDLWWAPVNVGATSINSPGTLFQYGRNSGWVTLDECVNAAEDQLAVLGKGDVFDKVFYAGGPMSGVTSPSYWFTADTKSYFDANIKPKWAAVSDGANNPCPAGWRLPSKAEYAALLTPDAMAGAKVTNSLHNGITVYVATIPAKGNNESIIFQYEGKVLSGGTRGQQPGNAYFWPLYEDTFDNTPYSFTPSGVQRISQSMGVRVSLADGCYLRCVKDVSK